MTNLDGLLPADPDTTARGALPRKRFVLSGHSALINPANQVVRGDLADVELANQVFAPHYAKALSCRLLSDADIHAKPAAESDRVDRLLTGDVLDLFDVTGDWGWVRTKKAVGYIKADRIVPA